ncbi:hypothetical protein LZ683_17600 [Comamonas testosteroni]|uniref:hypothetical protein n=1 Tax=Comamonas testosteroni TaxID=285 RepID=UPI0023AB514E|nr:hypothetical protein [Comamonas testosteroni]WEE75971.1 hypothetical protein LZ683_17600 [Comamonas testosteroni]
MNMQLMRLLARYHSPAQDGSDLGGQDDAADVHEDRGDTVVEDRGDGLDNDLSLEALQGLLANGEVTGATEEDGGRAPSSVPISRFQEVNDRRKTAEQALADAQAELARYRATDTNGVGAGPAQTNARAAPPEPSFDLDAQEEAYANALLDGDTKGAAAIRREINQHLEHAAVKRYHSESNQQRASQEYSALVDKVMDAHPWLDQPEGSQAMDLIVELVDARVRKGASPAQALSEAVQAIVPRFTPAGSQQLPATTATDPRIAASLARGARASNDQPAAMLGGIGNRSTGGMPDVDQLDDEQFSRLSEAEKRKMRGD